MIRPLLALGLILLAARATAAPDSTATPADTTGAPPRVVRTLPTTEVRALLGDLHSSQTTHFVPARELRAFPVDGVADVLGLQPGVVAQAEELHVRGGRAGETMLTVDGITLNEPQRYHAMEVPLLAIESAELVSGALEAPLGGGIAGVMQLRTVNPGARPSLAWRWQGDAGLNTRYDQLSARVSSPLGVAGLGMVAAADGRFDNTSLPMLRSQPREEFWGLPFGWRAENRLLGSFKLAPIDHPERFTAELFASRQVHEPYSPNWSLDGWTLIPFNPKMSPVFTPDEQPGSMRYRAADRLGITDERQMAAQVRMAGTRGAARGALSLSWLGSRSITSLGGNREPLSAMHRPKYGNSNDRDQFYVLWGDYPLYRESASDVVTMRGDGEWTSASGTRWQGGAGLHYDVVALDQVDWLAFGRFGVDIFGPPPVDSIRSYRARAPGAFTYAQARWQSGGLIMNTGLRAEYFTPGETGAWQTLPGGAGQWSFAPRLSVAYPISVRDVFSFSYLRIQQAPGRDYLYDNRKVTSNREPLGNPDLSPATAISYEAAVKHVFAPDWALQSAIFFRDVFNQVGVEDFSTPSGPVDVRYVSVDEGSVLGLEWTLLHDISGRLRLEGDYTWMQSWGNESRPGGDPYGPVRVAHTPATGDQPLSWDRRHSFLFSALWTGSPRWSLGWTTAVGSPLPWTPKPLRQPVTDIGVINSERLGWSENTNVAVGWSPKLAGGVRFGLEVRNLFDFRGDRLATLDGYPNPVINTLYDDYGAYRTETGQGGGAYWTTLPTGDPGHWVPVHDARLSNPPRAVRASVSANW